MLIDNIIYKKLPIHFYLLSLGIWMEFLTIVLYYRLALILLFFFNLHLICSSCWQIDRDHCTPNPCRNGGQCLNTPDDYYCQCSGDGWSWHGKNCTVPTDVAGAGATRSSAATTTTTLTTTRTTTTSTTTATPTTTTTTSIRPPLTPPLQRSTAITPVATMRRPGAGIPGTMTWRQQQKQHGDGDDDTKGKCLFSPYSSYQGFLLLLLIITQYIRVKVI